MYCSAGYDKLVIHQSLYLERSRLQMEMARDQKSTKAKRCRKPPLARKGVALPQVQVDSLMDSPLDHHDVSMEELFGSEDMDILMDNVSRRKSLDCMMEVMIGPDDSDVSMEDATAGKDGEVDMADSSSGEEEGQLEALLEEEDNSNYDCQTEDEDGMEEGD
ncbi:hypothetical protein BS17DRAFT_770717 [Gyrodon lividus]|nr:hypothetical protein BS17DRAFT_770717 [Gyrodon lividus]